MARSKEKGQPQELNRLETRILRPADPATLMQDNPAALIVNKESYRLMASRFSPGRFDAPQVARVVTYSADGEKVIKDFIVDGMTRTKYVDDNAKEIAESHPDFVFRVNDVTQDIIDNPDVVTASERKDKQNALTLVQYMRAVIPPTVEHTKIAPDRIAAHLINGWRSMVGEQIAKRYSAVAALNLLTHPNTNIATDQALQKELQKQLNRMTGETEEERDRLQNALVQMAQIIRQSKINKPEVAKAAYVLVASASDVIGGEKETARQIYGMLHSLDVEKKLQRAYPGEGVGEQSARELAREELGTNIARFFRDNKDRRNISELMGAFNTAYQDSDLTIHQLNDILGSEKPVQRYVEIKSDLNRAKLERNYRVQIQRQGRQELSDVEIKLLENLGFRQYLMDSDMPGLLRVLDTAQSTISKARAQSDKFRDEAEKEKLVTAGVRPDLINQALIDIAEAEEQILSATTSRAVTGKTQELNEIIVDISRKIDYQKSSHAVSLMIDGIDSVSFTAGHGGPQARRSLINYVMQEFRVVNERNIQDVRQMVNKLLSLDPDLFNKVMDGDIRLAMALDQQRRKRSGAETVQAVIPVKPAAVFQREDSKPASVEASRSADQPPASEEKVVFVKEDLDKVRLEKNRNKLDSLLEEINEKLSTIDLNASELTPEERQRLQDLIDKLGELAFGRDGTSRIMTEDYPALLRKDIAMQEARVAGEIADNYKSTGTSR